jgi:DNA-binding transcriptional LysR family regulator
VDVEIRQFELLVAVAEEGSIHGAARRLQIAQPSVSQALRKLERQVGASLVVRSHRGVELTPAGVILRDRAEDILARVALAVVDARSSQKRRSLRIGLVAGRLSAAELTSSIITGFRRQHPDLDLSVVELTFSDQAEAVSTGQVDVAIVRPPYSDDRMEMHPLFNEPRLLCFGVDHPFAETERLSLADVLDEPVVHLTKAPPRWAEFWQLDALRNEPGRTVDDPSVTVSELQVTMATKRCVISVASSGWRMGISNPFLRAVTVDGLGAAEVAIAAARTRRNPDVDAFVQCARTVTEEMIDTVPDAWIPARALSA